MYQHSWETNFLWVRFQSLLLYDSVNSGELMETRMILPCGSRVPEPCVLLAGPYLAWYWTKNIQLTCRHRNILLLADQLSLSAQNMRPEICAIRLTLGHRCWPEGSCSQLLCICWSLCSSCRSLFAKLLDLKYLSHLWNQEWQHSWETPLSRQHFHPESCAKGLNAGYRWRSEGTCWISSCSLSLHFLRHQATHLSSHGLEPQNCVLK